ncbi:hypothetical protein GO496_04040 [Acidovorax citrulli]|nr:hypothetical protein [Paracidovorax citrulli]
MIKLLPAGTGYARLSEAVTTEYGQLIDLVRQAVRDKLRLTANSDYYVDVRGIWPERVVVGFKGRLYSYPYTIGQDNTVAVGDAAEVVAEYNPVGAASAPAAAPAGDVAVREAAAQDVTAQFREAKDGSIEVTLIRAGRSGNRNYYPDATLREAAAMFDGVRVFAKSDADHIAGKGQGRPQPDRRHLRCAVRGGPDARHGRSGGHVQAPQPQRCRGHEDDRGRQARDAEPAGPVHRCHRTHQAAKAGAEQLREAVKFLKVDSVDLIVEPGAGGGLDRLVEAATDSINSQGTAMPLWKQRMLEAIKAKDPVKHAAVNVETATDDEVTQLYEAVCGPWCRSPVPTASQKRRTRR